MSRARTDSAPFTLGYGHVGSWLWRKSVSRETGVPFGLVESHGGCSVVLLWAPADDDSGFDVRELWTVESLIPLTLVEYLHCPGCDIVGAIRGGWWVPGE